MTRLRSLPAAFAALAAFLSAVPPASAQFSLPGSGSNPVASQASMVSEVRTIAAGETFTVALRLEHPEKWHSYYRNSGGVELPPSISWTLPDGFSAGDIQWPTPTVKEGYFGPSFIYEGSPSFLIDITPPATLTAGESVTLRADASWQICDQSCIDEKAAFTLELAVGESAVADPELAADFAAAREAQPAASQAWSFSAQPKDDQQLTLRLSPGEGAPDSLEGLEFIPDQPFLNPLSEGGSVERDEESGDWLITIPRRLVDPLLEEEIPQGDSFSGILVSSAGPLDPATGRSSILVPATPIRDADAASTAAAARADVPFKTILGVFGGMFLGGLILNLMPCVFPVIGLKIMGFVQQAGQDRRKIAFHGFAFTAGVLASFAVLSAILFAVLRGGEARGWGFQLEDPWMVYGLLLLMFVLALNMFGVFEIGASATSVGGNLQSKQGVSGSFFSGVLATVVATPCSAPFLGAAIGVAVTLPATPFFGAFALMALGLATPYLVLSLYPQLLDRLPRPGPWMESFKQGMSFLLFGTAGYLLWVYGGLTGLDHLLNVFLGLAVIATAAWIYGRWFLPHHTPRARWIGLSTALVFLAFGLTMARPPVVVDHALVWEDWSEQRVQEELAAGRPVFVDFTAKWCLTCQVNKRVAYTEEVSDAMRARNVVTLIADKTRPDPAIDRKLEQLGRSAIPVNVLYVPGEEPVITREVLTPGYMMDLLRRAVPLGEDRPG